MTHNGFIPGVVRDNPRRSPRFTREVPGYGQLFALRDITERRASDEQRPRLERIIQTMTQGFAIVSAEEGAIMSGDPSFDRMHGCREGELISRKFQTLLDRSAEDSRTAAKELISHTLNEGFREGEMNCRRSDGTAFIAHARLNLMNTAKPGSSQLFRWPLLSRSGWSRKAGAYRRGCSKPQGWEVWARWPAESRMT